MEKYLMFGWLPIRVSPEGTWTADAGGRLVNQAANFYARAVLSFIAFFEEAFGVPMPVVMTPATDPEPAAR